MSQKIEDYYLIKDNRPENQPGWFYGLNASGYAGCTKESWIVDRRQFPDAMPIHQNSLFGVAAPKEVTQEQRDYLLKNGHTFPLDERELDVFNKAHKDFPHKLILNTEPKPEK